MVLLPWTWDLILPNCDPANPVSTIPRIPPLTGGTSPGAHADDLVSPYSLPPAGSFVGLADAGDSLRVSLAGSASRICSSASWPAAMALSHSWSHFAGTPARGAETRQEGRQRAGATLRAGVRLGTALPLAPRVRAGRAGETAASRRPAGAPTRSETGAAARWAEATQRSPLCLSVGVL